MGGGACCLLPYEVRFSVFIFGISACVGLGLKKTVKSEACVVEVRCDDGEGRRIRKRREEREVRI